MTASCRKLVDEYIAWLRERITIEEIDGICEITTPFLDAHNDLIQFYVVQEANGLLLTDDGYTLANLESSGCAIETENRRQLLYTLLNSFGITIQNEAITVRCSPSTFPAKKHSLLQAMMAVSDLFLTVRPHAKTTFLQDVGQYLDEHDVRFTEAVEFAGKSGLMHRFDFIIPKSKSAPDRFVRALNHPTKDASTQLLFAWTDTRDARHSKSECFAFLNDVDAPVTPEVLTALHEYEVHAVLWTRRLEFASALAS